MSVTLGYPVIGIVGGIGSGKSTIAREIEAIRPRLRRLSADPIGHEVLRNAEVKSRIEAIFGSQVFDAHGEVDRSALAERVFGTDRETERKRLEEIVHPAIRERIAAHLEEWSRTGEVDAVVLDAAVLLEAGWQSLCDAVVYVDVEAAERFRRVAESRHWSREEFSRRESSQMPLEEKQRRSHKLVHNAGDPRRCARELIPFIESLTPRT